VNTLAALVGEVVLQDVDFQQQTYDWLASARPQMVQGLSRIPGLHVYPGAANFLLVRSEDSVLDLQLQLLKQDQIYIRDCMSFPELGDRFFRVAVRTIAENQRLIAALDRALDHLRKKGGNDRVFG